MKYNLKIFNRNNLGILIFIIFISNTRSQNVSVFDILDKPDAGGASINK